MEMKVLKQEYKLCPCCMEEHEIQTVLVRNTAMFKNAEVTFEGSYYYCSLTEELYMDEQQISNNDLSMKDAYRRAHNLLTSSEIRVIREKYGISQTDLCILLGWGEKTITRYEGHHVQDRAHDSILKKIDQDPEWFLCLLQDAKDSIPAQSYQKYKNAAIILYENNQDAYLRKAIEARYIKFKKNPLSYDNITFSLDKAVEAKGKSDGIYTSLENLIKNCKFSVGAAMDALGFSEEDRNGYPAWKAAKSK